MAKFYRDLPAAKQREQTEDMLRVYREMNDTVVSTFEKVVRLLVAANGGGILLVAGLAGALNDASRDSPAFLVAGTFFFVGLCCAGAQPVLILRRFQKLSAQTIIDIERVHRNDLSIDDSDQHLQVRTRQAGFAKLIHWLVGGAIAFFVLGVLATLPAFASL